MDISSTIGYRKRLTWTRSENTLAQTLLVVDTNSAREWFAIRLVTETVENADVTLPLQLRKPGCSHHLTSNDWRFGCSIIYRKHLDPPMETVEPLL